MDQGVIATFKAYYLCYGLSKAIKPKTIKSAPTLTEFWKSNNIRNVSENIPEAWYGDQAILDPYGYILPNYGDDSIDYEINFAKATKNSSRDWTTTWVQRSRFRQSS
jgi:hypothetical protein